MKTFILLAAVFLPLFLLLLPPFQAPDEGYHFVRAYQVSEGKFVEEVQEGRAGATVPESLVSFLSAFARLPLHPAAKTSFAEIESFRKIPLEPGRTQFFGFEKILPHPSLPYLPQALGIALGRALRLPPIYLLYLGRAANALLWTLLAWAALRRVPIQRWVWLLLFLTPMSLQQAASLSPDAATNGMAWLLLATVLRLALDPEARVSPGGLAAAGLLSLGLTVAKLAYAPHALMFLLLPSRKFASKARWAATVTGCLALNGLALALCLKAGGLQDWPALQTQRQQLWAAPWVFLGLLGETWLRLGPRYWAQSVGWLGHLDTPLPNPLAAVYALVLLTAAWWERGPFGLPRGGKALPLTIAGLELALIWTGLYLAWNLPGAAWIHGGQGRYLIPILPLVLLPLYRAAPAGAGSPESRLAWTALCTALMTLTTAMILLLRRFYGI